MAGLKTTTTTCNKWEHKVKERFFSDENMDKQVSQEMRQTTVVVFFILFANYVSNEESGGDEDGMCLMYHCKSTCNIDMVSCTSRQWVPSLDEEQVCAIKSRKGWPGATPNIQARSSIVLFVCLIKKEKLPIHTYIVGARARVRTGMRRGGGGTDPWRGLSRRLETKSLLLRLFHGLRPGEAGWSRLSHDR